MNDETNDPARPGASPTVSPALKYGVSGLVVGLIAGGALGVAVSEFGGQTSFPMVLAAQVNGAALPLDLPEEPYAGSPREPERAEPAPETPSGG